jgi:hypothetical protein
MNKDKEAAERLRKRKQRPLGEEAKKEHTAYDVLDGPFARMFHMFFKRRIITKANMKPYPWFIGGIHRAARMLDVADLWERAVLLIFPLPFLLAWLQPRLGVPPQLQGYGLLLAGAYTGYHFVLWVFLDRRLDFIDASRVYAGRRKRFEARDERLLRRRQAAKQKPEIRAAAEEALKRGRMKAQAAETIVPPPPPAEEAIPVPVRPAAVSLDDLLR